MGSDHLLIHIITKSLNLLPLYISESTSPVGTILGVVFAVLAIVIIIIIVIIVLYYLR